MKLLIVSLLLLSLVSACEKEAPPPRPAAQQTDLEILRDKIKANPKDADALYSLADLYDRSNMYQEEIDLLQKVVALKPDMGYAYLRLGNAYNRLAQYQNAVNSYQKARKYMPKNPVVYNNIAISYGHLGKTDNEIESLKKAISLRPQYASARFNLGMAFLKKGARSEALKQYEALNTFDTGMAKALKKEIDAKAH
jgi:tetratricopeptide (TPR) repeat protein